MSFQGTESYDLEFIADFGHGLEIIRQHDDAFLIQCSAHPEVHEIAERYCMEVFRGGYILYPTKALAVLARRDVESPRRLGLVPATAGYINRENWDEIIDVRSKPILAEELLSGRYDAGLTHLEHLEMHPNELRLEIEICEIDTTWIVYGTKERFEGHVIGIPSAELFQKDGAAATA
jgi:hypothetical protein